jgi:hypothetical protein
MKKPAVGSEESRQSPVKKVSSQTDVRSRKAATCKLKIDRNLSTKILKGEQEGLKKGRMEGWNPDSYQGGMLRHSPKSRFGGN